MLPLLALVAIVALVDRGLWGRFGPWEEMDHALLPCGADCRVVRNKLRAEIELSKLGRADPTLRRVVVVGSSRAGAGFVPARLPVDTPGLPGLHLAKVAIAAAEPYTMRGLASRLRSPEVDEVVLFLSEFDTHRPPYLVPMVGFGGGGAWIDLVRFGGPRFAWRHRDGLIRLGVASQLGTYRHRDVLQALGRTVAPWPSLRLAEAEDRDDGPSIRRAFVGFANALEVPADPGAVMPWDEFLRVRAVVGAELGEPVAEGPFRQVRSISAGPHVALQEALVRSTVELLIERGIRVLIVEAPVHPLAEAFYDLRARSEYRAFASRLERHPHVELLALSELRPFQPNEFRDLTHLNEAGAERLTREIVARLAQHASSVAPAGGT